MTNILCCFQIVMITLMLGRKTRLTLWLWNHNKYLKINIWKNVCPVLGDHIKRIAGEEIVGVESLSTLDWDEI